MYTQCPNCNVIFSMSEEDLDVYQGLVRCGRCNEVFNASWNLVDSVPHQESAGLENVTPKPDEKAVATPDVIDEFILDNVESDEDSGIPGEPAEVLEQEQSFCSENEFDGNDIEVERDLSVAEPEPIEAATDALQATDKSMPVESVSDEAGLEGHRIDDDSEGSVESIDKDELERVPESETEPESDGEENESDLGLPENGEPEALDLVNESLRAAETEQDYPEAEVEPELDEAEEAGTTELGLPDVEAIHAESSELGPDSLETAATTEEIIMEEPGPDDDVLVTEESPEAVAVEEIYTEVEIEPESDEAEEAGATELGLSDAEALQAESSELKPESLETVATAEEIIMEEPSPDDELDTTEESLQAVEAEQPQEAEIEPDEGEEVSSTGLSLPDAEALQAESSELKPESLETVATAEEIIMEEPDQDDDLGFKEKSPKAVDEGKISWETEADSESDIDHADIEQIEQGPESEVVASTESSVVDELDKSIQPPEQTTVNEFESFKHTQDETSSVSDASHTHNDEDNAIADVDSALDNEDTSIGDIGDDTVKTIDEVLSDITELEPVNDDVSKEPGGPEQEQEETLSNVTDLPVQVDEQVLAEESSHSENIEPGVDADEVDSAKRTHADEPSVPDTVAEEIVIEAPTRLWRMDEEIGEEAEDKQLPGWSAPEPRSVPASREAGDVRRVKIPQPRPVLTAAWIIGSMVLLFGLVWQIKGHYLTDLAQIPSLRAPLDQMCKYLSCTVPPRTDIKSIDLVSTSVDPHPVTPGALRVSANLVNRAAFAQEFPPLEITLTDKEGKVVGRRTYLPHEYRVDAPNKMLPNVLERTDFDLAQPDETAVGYEIQLVAR